MRKFYKLLLIALVPLIASCDNGAVPSSNPSEDPEDDPTPTEYWPSSAISTFLSEKNITASIPGISISDSNDLLSVNKEVEDEIEYLSININDDRSIEYKNILISNSYSLNNEYYYDSNEVVALKVTYEDITNISIYDAKDLSVTPPLPEDDTETVTYKIEDLFGKDSQKIITKTSEEGITFTASVGSGTQNPASTKTGDGNVSLYVGNTFTITGRVFTEITLNFESSPSIESDDTITFISDNVVNWKNRKTIFTITALKTSRLVSVTCKFIKHNDDPIPQELKTIAEVYEIAKTIEYSPNEKGWYLSNKEVIVRIEAVDAIDSVSTAGLYGNARGKTLVVDETGYIICSSGVSNDSPISFYQRVKDYIKQGRTQYEVYGHIAFFNGVVEINVDSYKYIADLVINKNYELLKDLTFTSSNDFVEDVLDNVVTNDKGYGVKNIVKFTGLTYFNKYNEKAGSYYFLDQDGMIVPVYSLLDKDGASLIKGNCYDIYGYETLYLDRPSLRILDVSKSNHEPVEFNFDENVTEINSVANFYNIGQSKNDSYRKSELTVYKADLYVSTYGADKYTVNTTYIYDSYSHEYTTGSTQVNSASLKSLGIFNEDLDYKQLFLNFIINTAESVEEVESKKVTLYFTLARLDTVDKSNYWRINVFEDLVFSIDYYKASKMNIKFDVNESGVTCTREDGVYQTWSKGNLSVTNSTTDEGIIKRDTEFLKVVNDTALTIAFDKDIVGFTIYKSSFSSLDYVLGSSEIRAYRQYSDFVEILLKTPTKNIEFTYIGVAGSSNYLKITSMEIRYNAN